MEPTPPVIDLRAVSKSYRMGKERIPVLHDISLTVRSGEFAVIMGPSGSGKSTLLNILGCLDLPDSGVYLLDGVQVKDLSSRHVAHLRNLKIGFVFQNFNLFPRMNVFQNAQLPLIYSDLGPKDRKARVESLLKKVGLWERRTHLPSEISGGQKQRTAIARALSNRPSLILADEPTGNLDSATTREIMGLFALLHQEGHTVVLITHEKDVAAYGQTLYTLVDGKMEYAGTPADL